MKRGLGPLSDEVARQAVADVCDGLAIIGQGQRATLYRLADGRVLKLYHPQIPDEVVQAEYALSQAANRAGLPSWAVHELIVEGGWRALLGDFVEGRSVSETMRRQPWRVPGLLRGLAAIQARLHTTAVATELPARLHDPKRVKGYLRGLPAPLATLVEREVIAADTQGFCHGDFHGGNVLASPQGLTTIDWDRAGRGPVAADVGRTLAWLTLGPTDSRKIGKLELGFRNWLAEAYMAEYCRLTGTARRPILAWLMFEIIRRRRAQDSDPAIRRHLKYLARKLRQEAAAPASGGEGHGT